MKKKTVGYGGILVLVLLVVLIWRNVNKTKVASIDGDFDCVYSSEDNTVSIIGTIEGDVFDSIIIPDRLLYQCPGQYVWYTVQVIEEGAFKNFSKLKKVEISKNIKLIGDSAFENCNNLKKVIYCGREEEWKQIEIGSNNECLLNAKIIFKE